MLKQWVPRPIVLFAAAYTIIGVLHELAHALTAYVLGVPFTIFHLYVNLAPGEGDFNRVAVIRAAGPTFCLCLGFACWLGYKKTNGSRAALPLLYLAWFSVVTFFGNLLGTPAVGDFSSLAITFGSPMSVRYAAAVIGLLAICGLSFFIGTELRRWAPAGVTSLVATIGMIVLPVIVGTVLALLIFMPMPWDWISARIGESAFWIFAALGAFVSRRQPADSSRDLGLHWPDIALLLTAVVVARVMAIGIAYTP